MFPEKEQRSYDALRIIAGPDNLRTVPSTRSMREHRCSELKMTDDQLQNDRQLEFLMGA